MTCGRVTPRQLVRMSVFDMAPERLKEEREKLAEETLRNTIEIPDDERMIQSQRYRTGTWLPKPEDVKYYLPNT